MIYLREALVGEARELSNIAIRSKAYWDYSEAFIQACKQDLTIDETYIHENYVYVLKNEEKIAGFFTFERGSNDCLDFFYINPKFIGKGFGKVLWKYVIEKARELGIKSFTIDSDPYAKGFYEKMGAKQIGEAPSTVINDRMLPLMKFTIGD